jgi:hypothetical protein
MARSIETINNEILATKASQSALDGLDSTSDTAIWRLIYYVTSVAINFHEQLWDLFKKDLEDIRDTTPVQTEIWWNDRMKNQFQYDMNDITKSVLVIGDDFVPRYETVDETTRIVDFSATKQTENSRQVNIKIAKDDGTGSPTQLSLDELNAARGYVDQIQGAGLFINTISFPADELAIDVNIYFDGQYIESNVLFDVKESIRTYLKTLKFDGTIQIIKLTDAIQSAPGVTDVFYNNATGKPSSGPAQTFDRIYTTLAGYALLNEVDSIFTMILEK